MDLGASHPDLFYDPSGEIALPPNQRSKAWTDGPGATELGIDSLEVHHIPPINGFTIRRI